MTVVHRALDVENRLAHSLTNLHRVIARVHHHRSRRVEGRAKGRSYRRRRLLFSRASLFFVECFFFADTTTAADRGRRFVGSGRPRRSRARNREEEEDKARDSMASIERSSGASMIRARASIDRTRIVESRRDPRRPIDREDIFKFGLFDVPV